MNISLLHYDDIKELSTNQAMSVIEKMVHGTAKRTARYHGFDQLFYKMPSYLRRNAIVTANAKVDSYKKLVVLWEVQGSKGQKPKFTSSKQYNCDLSAAKNIAARFILRCKEKSMSETAWLQAQTKVSELCTRTKCTLATVIRLSAVVTAS